MNYDHVIHPDDIARYALVSKIKSSVENHLAERPRSTSDLSPTEPFLENPVLDKLAVTEKDSDICNNWGASYGRSNEGTLLTTEAATCACKTCVPTTDDNESESAASYCN